MLYRSLFSAVLLCSVAGCVTPMDQRPAASLKVDSSLRTLLDQFANPSSRGARDLALRQLHLDYNGDPSTVIVQAVLYDIAHSTPGDTTSTPTLTALAEALPISKNDLFFAALPLLTTDDASLHPRLVNLIKLAGLDQARAYLKAHPVDDGNGLPEALLLDDPDSAMSFLTQTFPISDAERHRLDRADTELNVASRAAAGDASIAEAQTQADALANSARWWVRLYVATQIGKTPAIVSDRTAQGLTRDSDFRVRAIAVQRLSGAKPQS